MTTTVLEMSALDDLQTVEDILASQVDSFALQAAEDISLVFEVLKGYGDKLNEGIEWMQQQAAFLCACAIHSVGLMADSWGINSWQMPGFETMNSWSMGVLTEFGHEGHEHCSKCGGHYKDGKCEKCGSKHNHLH